ncbi:MAG: type IX secretion system sortase PorU [Sphingobacteriaceae bacterium]|nr:type IX secretion system sortase PorU [Cytophagaceae bacterium]
MIAWSSAALALAQPASSVLARGAWLKIGVTQPGVYRLGAGDLREAGFALTGLDPRRLRLYGNGGGMLPQSNAMARPVDLTETAIQVGGEADGRFDEGDYLLFYAEGPHTVRYDPALTRFAHQTNVYADTSFYFLTLADSPGLRVAERPSVTASTTLTAFDEYVFLEKDLRNIIASGREWYGESLTFGDLALTFSLPNLLPNSPLLVTSATMAAAQAETAVQVKLGGQTLGTQTFGTVTPERYDFKGMNAVNTFSSTLATPASDGTLRLVLSYDRRGQASAQAYFNYLGMQARRELRWSGDAFRFRVLDSRQQAAVTYQVANAPAGLRIWDVTRTLQPASQALTMEGNTARFGATADTLREFVAFLEKDVPEPASMRNISSQNLHGLTATDLLIITAPAYREQAERLAQFRRQHDKLTTTVVTTEQVFNEFSSGRPDPSALRDFARFLYQQPGSTLKYLLLFGDATYDYRGRTGGNFAQGYVPVYESRESLHPIYSYSSDDYFGFLEDHEGDWPETFSGDHTLDIGVGRLPVKTSDEAAAVVDKLIRYENPASLGPWRQRVTFVADNGDYNLHQQDADNLARQLTRNRPNLILEKLYLDAFPTVSTPTGAKAPAVNTAINRQFQEGALIINYTGHGGESGWAQEQVLTRADIFSWRNADRMPLLVTATCEFGRYDDPGLVSGAELALLQRRAGAIGLLTTTRAVFANTNFLVNEAFDRRAFEPKNGVLPRLGEVMRLTKNESLSGPINRNFTLLGDPSMRLSLPNASVALTTVPDTLRALQRVTLNGEVRRPDGNRDGTFNGTVTLTVFDKPTTLRTPGSDDNPSMSYDVQRSVLFSGVATVRAGAFSSTFVVPGGLDPKLGRGKISFYAQRSDNSGDAGGAAEVWMGGKSSTPSTDTQPPQLQAFLNDTTFRDGDEVSATSRLLLRLRDDSGLDVSGLAGHDLTATLNDTLRLVLNAAYLANPDDFRSGSLTFALPTLPPGTYTLRVKAWDVAGNPVEQTLHFSVGENKNPSLRNVVSFPNPFGAKTTFRVEHESLGDDLDVEVLISDLSGRTVRSLRTTTERAESPVDVLTWDGRTDSGAPLANGMYFYRIFARSFQTSRQQSGSGKVILAR